MMHGILHWILGAVAAHGYWVVAAVICVEAAGAPLPGETVLLLAAFLARQGDLSLPLVIAVAALAAIVGDNFGYLLGRRGGRPLADRYGRFVLLTPERLDRCEAFFAHHGGKAVFLARWSAGLRVAGAWIAGMSRMPWPRFLMWNALGGIAWAVTVGVAGYALGASYEMAGQYLGKVSIALIAVVAVCAVYAVLRHKEIVPELHRPHLRHRKRSIEPPKC